MSMVMKVILPPLLTPYGADKMETECRTSLDDPQDVFAVASPAGIVALCSFAPQSGLDEGLGVSIVAPIPVSAVEVASPLLKD
jgi:hypothetical protein